MAFSHCQIRTRIQIPNPMATLHHVEVFIHTARRQIQILILTANYRNGVGIRVRLPNVNEPKGNSSMKAIALY